LDSQGGAIIDITMQAIGDERQRRAGFNSSLGNRPIYLPRCSADLWLQTEPSHDLLQRGIVALGGKRLGRDIDFGGVCNIGAIDAPQA